jgi:hypothetical protein
MFWSGYMNCFFAPAKFGAAPGAMTVKATHQKQPL